MKKVNVGSGDIIGRINIEEFLNHINRLDEHNNKSIVQLAHNYEITVESLVE